MTKPKQEYIGKVKNTDEETDDEVSESGSESASNEQLILSDDKSPQDQIIFIDLKNPYSKALQFVQSANPYVLYRFKTEFGTYAKITVRCKTGEVHTTLLGQLNRYLINCLFFTS